MKNLKILNCGNSAKCNLHLLQAVPSRPPPTNDAFPAGGATAEPVQLECCANPSAICHKVHFYQKDHLSTPNWILKSFKQTAPKKSWFTMYKAHVFASFF
eukprot:EG_transcript_17643